MQNLNFLPVLFFLIVLLLLSVLIRTRAALIELRKKYSSIIDIEAERAKILAEIVSLKQQTEAMNRDFSTRKAELTVDYDKAFQLYQRLKSELASIEESLEITEFGIYKPYFDFESSEQYKTKLDEIVERQKQLIKTQAAIVCPKEWTVDGNRVKGQKMINGQMKLMARAFNGECDAAILKVRWNNIHNLEERIKRAYEVINKLESVHEIVITKEYLNLKLDELHLAHEYQEKLYREKEEQKRIAEQMREEEKVRVEIEKAKKEAEDDEQRYQKALAKATAELEKTKGKELEELNNKITALQEQLKIAQEKKERAMARAEMTKAGHVYVLSNIGSFGDDVYKIGMTRRLEPLDRVKELSDASVPFNFDVHAMIYSEDAPALENELQQAFDHRRVNMVNNRREFFKVPLNEIESAAKLKNAKVEFTLIAEAREYRETLALAVQAGLSKNTIEGSEKKIVEEFPATL